MIKHLTSGILCCLLAAGTVFAQNTLSSQEKKEGWKLLFNGKNTDGWHNYGTKGVGPGWIIEDGALKLNAVDRAGNKTKNAKGEVIGNDIVTDEVFSGDFEFKADWKVSKQANSGIFFFVAEAPKYKEIYHTGLELQVIDDSIYEGAPENKHRAGDLFGVTNARIREPLPVGQWNKVLVRLKGNKLTVDMNGYRIQELDLNSPSWKKSLEADGSPLKNSPLTKGIFKGAFGLQDWGSMVWYRNLKYRKI
jgi:hypothetical protein